MSEPIKVMDEDFRLHDEHELAFDVIITEECKAILIDFSDQPYPGAGGEVLLEILPDHQKVSCFVYSDGLWAFREAKLGQEMSINFALLPLEVRPSKSNKKIEHIDGTNYRIFGEVVESEFGLSSVNCGFFLQINSEFKKGETIEAVGRLFAYG